MGFFVPFAIASAIWGGYSAYKQAEMSKKMLEEQKKAEERQKKEAEMKGPEATQVTANYDAINNDDYLKRGYAAAFNNEDMEDIDTLLGVSSTLG